VAALDVVNLGRMAVATAVLWIALAGGGAQARGAALTEPPAALEAALECRGDLGPAGPPPVILVHGTGSSPEDSFSFGYERVLPKLGFAACTVRLPGRGLVDQQRSIQYVVYAIREVARRAGTRVSLVGHSQGATLAAYATYFWPDLPAKVDDVIGLAGPYHGTTTANDACSDSRCAVYAWQLRTASRLNAAFAGAAQPAGPSYTAIATVLDELVAPAPQAARLEGAANIVIQDLCPARPVDHYLLPGDAVSFALALDALTHAGPADPARFDPATCLQTIIPGADVPATALTAPGAVGGVAARLATAPDVDREPQLRCPFDAADCPAVELRLTRRCVAGGRLRAALAGDVDAVRSVDFKLGRRLAGREERPPFAFTLGRRAVRRARGSRLRAVVSLADSGGRVALARTLPRCAG
jgi:pimeloyl-ACP methyl ester carboxylesterase